MRRCQTCVLPEAESIPFDAKGKCRLCNSPAMLAHVTVKPDAQRLSAILDEVRARGRGRDYDCVVGLSGGRDSTYMLHQLVRVHKLRCVAVFGRTMFTPPETEWNVVHTTNELGVRLVETSVPPARHRRVAAFALRKWAETGQPLFVNLACAPCKMVNRDIFRWAQRLGVRTVICGGNRYEYFPSGPASIDIGAADRYSLRNMVKDNLIRVFRGCSFLLGHPSVLLHLPSFFLGAILYINPYSVFMRLRYPKILRFDYFHYADWDETEVHKALTELQWRLPSDCTSTWRADCLFEAIKNAAFQKQLGYTYTEALYSNLIRAGKMERGVCLERLSRETVSEQRLHRALDLIGLPADGRFSRAA